MKFVSALLICFSFLSVSIAAPAPVPDSITAAPAASSAVFSTVTDSLVTLRPDSKDKKDEFAVGSDCYVSSGKYEVSTDLSFGFYLMKSPKGKYTIKWYYDYSDESSFKHFKIKFKHNSDWINKLFHTTRKHGFFYSWSTSDWFSLKVQHFEISFQKKKDIDVTYSTACNGRENCIPVVFPDDPICGNYFDSSSLSSATSSSKPRVSSASVSSLSEHVTSTSHESKTEHSSFPESITESSSTATITPAPSYVSISFSVSTSSHSDSVKTTSASYYPEELECPKSVPAMYSVTNNTVLGYYIIKQKDGLFRIDWFFTFTQSFDPDTTNVYFSQNYGSWIDIFSYFWDAFFFYSYTAESWEDLLEQNWELTFQQEDEKLVYFSSNCRDSDYECNLIVLPSYPPEICKDQVTVSTIYDSTEPYNSATVSSNVSTTDKVHHTFSGSDDVTFTTSAYLNSTTVPYANTSTPAVTVVTTTVSGEITSYTTTCPLSEPPSISSSYGITIVTDTISGIITSYTTTCPLSNTVTSSPSYSVTIVTETVSGIVSSYTTTCPLSGSLESFPLIAPETSDYTTTSNGNTSAPQLSTSTSFDSQISTVTATETSCSEGCTKSEPEISSIFHSTAAPTDSTSSSSAETVSSSTPSYSTPTKPTPSSTPTESSSLNPTGSSQEWTTPTNGETSVYPTVPVGSDASSQLTTAQPTEPTTIPLSSSAANSLSVIISSIAKASTLSFGYSLLLGLAILLI